jgi:hypothetical protein
MKNAYQLLNEKLEREINSLQRKINRQLQLNEVAQNNSGLINPANDPGFNPNSDASQQNRGYVSGLSPGNSGVIVANPAVVDQFAREKEYGRFSYDSGPSKPFSADTIGLGMGLGLDQNAFNATKAFIAQHHPEAMQEIEQSQDPNAIGYLSWKTVNQAVTNRDTARIKEKLQRWGLHDPNSASIPSALGDQYYTQDTSAAFAKRLKQMQDEIGGQRQKGKSVSNKVLNILNK